MPGNANLSAPVVFADRFYMSERALAEISSLGGYAWAGAKDGVDLADKIGGSSAVKVIVSEYVPVNLQVLGRAPGLKGGRFGCVCHGTPASRPSLDQTGECGPFSTYGGS